ncbi:MAG: hypothetical protein U0892_13530 [Pirellulales bacterium]
MIKHHSNGKHRILDDLKQLPAAAVSSDTRRMGELWSDVQEQIVTRSSDFIRRRPGTSLLIAAALGGMVGWLIKRRG